MKLAKEIGWKKVIFELDSKVAVDLIKNGCANTHLCRPIIAHVHLYNPIIQQILRSEFK